MRLNYGWLVSNTIADCLQRQIAQKVFKSKVKDSKLVLSTLVTTWLSNTAFDLLPIWLQTLVAIYSESRLILFSSFCVQPSENCCAVQFKSEQTPVPWAGRRGRRFRPAALHRIQFGTCSFVPMSYFYSETND